MFTFMVGVYGYYLDKKDKEKAEEEEEKQKELAGAGGEEDEETIKSELKAVSDLKR